MQANFDRTFVDRQVKAFREEMNLPTVWDIYQNPPQDFPLAKRLSFESNWIALRSIGLTDEEIERATPIMSRRIRLLYMQGRCEDKTLKPSDPLVFRRDHAQEKKDIQQHLAAGHAIPPEASFILQLDLDKQIRSRNNLTPPVFQYADAFNYINLRTTLGDKFDRFAQAQAYAHQGLENATLKLLEKRKTP